MGFIWFWLVAVMLVGYVVLDGFDLGVGILHLFLPRDESERQAALRSIGPVWDGNEVWLLAGGGTLYFAFPLLYASSFSGFYLPLMIVLWLLVLRGVSLELRNHLEVGVWRPLLDAIFGVASTLLAIFFGAAMANGVRGVPLDAEGFFFLPLWTNWMPGANPGVLDWYTVLGGVIALAALALHGALWLALKMPGALEQRARRLAGPLVAAVAALTVVGLAATFLVRPQLLDNYAVHPALYTITAGVAVALLLAWLWNRQGKQLGAFLASCAYLFLMLAGAACGVYPTLLAASPGAAGGDITIARALTGHHALAVGLVWWVVGMALAVSYIVFVYSRFKGKVGAGE